MDTSALQAAGVTAVTRPNACPANPTPLRRAVWCAPERDAFGVDPCDDAYELNLADAKAIMLHRKRTVGLVEVEGQAIDHMDGTKGTRGCLWPRYAELRGEQFSGRPSVAGGNRCVVECNTHRSRPCRRAP